MSKPARNDAATVEHLVRENLGLVRKIASQFYAPTLNYDDFVCAGNEGLLHAARTFDPTRSARFSPYAGWVIRGYMLNAVRDEWGGVKSAEKRRLFFGLRKQGLWDVSDPEVVGAALNVRPEIVLGSLPHFLHGHVRLDAPLDRDEPARTLSSLVTADSPDLDAGLDAARQRTLVEAAIFALPIRLRKIVRKRFYCDPPMLLDAIGDEMGLSRERVRQLEVKALKEIRRLVAGQVRRADKANPKRTVPAKRRQRVSA